MTEFEQNDMSSPLRLPKDREEYERQRDDASRDDIGITGTLFPDQEATVVISVDQPGWHHMDVEYAKLVLRSLAEVIVSAERHNQNLTDDPRPTRIET